MADAIHKQLLDAIKTRIDALNLVYDGGSIKPECCVRNRPYDGDQYYLGITIHPDEQGQARGNNCDDDNAYGVRVTIINESTQEDIGYLNDHLDFVQKIRNEFSWKKITGLTGPVGDCAWAVIVSKAKPLEDEPSNREDKEITRLMMTCMVREQVRT